MIPIIPYSHYYWVGGPPKVDASKRPACLRQSHAPGSSELALSAVAELEHMPPVPEVAHNTSRQG